ncbi:hypothetical protein [uncultured Subdoligranulum sp.]|uniref:hypothetical protein n=1 Tax=uncultured Subdoligranulum sp. TaxID=512298 RepID=UPI002631B1B1|nr:hypothetical protein [uncultured Subdoligranulum sp.]
MDRRIPVLLGASLLALLGLSGCGGSRIPEEELTALLNEQTYFTERMAGVESLEIEKQTAEDGVTRIDATIVSHNGFTRYTDDCTIELARDEETEEWTVTDLGGAAVSMEALYAPDAYAIDQVMTAETYCMLGIGGGGEESVLLPGYTLGEVALSNENPQFPTATAQISFEGQTYGWFTFHGSAALQLTYEPVRGGWEANAFTPNEDFSIDCALEGRTYKTEAFRDRESASYEYQDHCWYVTFGDFDWREGGLVGCSARKYNIEEGTDVESYQDRCYRIRRLAPSPIDLGNASNDWVLTMAPGDGVRESFPMRTLDDPTATGVVFWDHTSGAVDYGYACEQVDGPTPDSLTVAEPEPAALPVPEIAPAAEITADPDVKDMVVTTSGEETNYYDPETEVHWTIQYFYDGQGNQVGQINFREGEVYSRIKYIYNANNVKTAQFFYTGNQHTQSRYFDLDGNETYMTADQTIYWADGTTEKNYVTTTSTYDRLGRITAAESSDGSSTSYNYDEGSYRGWKHAHTLLANGEELQSTTNLHFDTDWRLIGEEVLDEDGNISKMIAHEYDEDGNEVRVTVTDATGAVIELTTRAFDEFGNVLTDRYESHGTVQWDSAFTTMPLSEALKAQASWGA